MSKYGLWYGKPLENYTKEALIEIIIHLSKEKEEERVEKQRQINFLKRMDNVLSKVV